VEARLSFVGVDSFQLEDPIINFNGLELPLALNQSARQFVKERLGSIERFSNHLALLGHDILIYENLRLPPEIRNRLINFHGVPLNMRLEGMNDNALVRPYCTVA
jgi:kynurenine formamidase